MAQPISQTPSRSTAPPTGNVGDPLPEGYKRIPKAERHLYYSRSSGGLVLHVNVGEQVMGPKGPATFGEKIVQFHPLNPTDSGGMPYGRFETTDQETIDFLDKRIVEVGDVMTEATFTALLQTPDDKTRVIEDQNRLIADLKRQNEEKDKQLSEGRK